MSQPDQDPRATPGFDEASDATSRTRLANERTYLAWWRTGLTCFAVSIGSGKVVPEVSSGVTWPYTVIGILFALLGTVCVGYAYQRQARVEAAVRRGGYEGPDERFLGVITIIGILLGIAVAAVLLIQS